MGIQGWQWLIILAIVLLLFGAARLPKLAKSVGQSARIFKSEVKTMNNDQHDEPRATESHSEAPRAVEGEVVDPTADVHRTRKHKDQP